MRRLALLVAGACLGGCASQAIPPYQAPAAPLPARYSEPAPGDAGWQGAAPADALPRGDWWTVFGDSAIDPLVQQALAGNPDLAQAEARVQQAEAGLRGAEAGYLPVLTGGLAAQRNRTSANRASLAPNVPVYSTVQNDFNPLASVRWEADLSGRIAASAQVAGTALEQARADRESVRLRVAATVVATVIALRALDSDLALLDQLVAQQERLASQLRARAAAGQGTALDSLPVETQMQANLAQRASLAQQRPALLHALATLTGQAPGAVRLAESGTLAEPPVIPPGLPASLLERRPDIASAERAVAQANAQVGVARSARYPTLILGANGGLDSRSLGSLFDAPSLVWALGATLTGTLADGGRTDAAIDSAEAGRLQAAGHYRSVVLQALQEVEDALAAGQALAAARSRQHVATQSAQAQLDLLEARMRAGNATSLDTLAAAQVVTGSLRLERQLQAQQLATSVYLVRALGGRW